MKIETYSQNFTPEQPIIWNEEEEGGLDFSQVAQAISRRVVIVVGITAVFASAAVFKALNSKPSYQASFEMLTEQVTIETQVISANNPDAITREEVVAIPADFEVKVKLLKSPKVMEQILENLQLQYPHITYDYLVKFLTIKQIDKNAEILAIGYKAPQSQEVEDVLQLVADTYLNYSLEVRQTGIRRALGFVEKQLPKLRERVETQQERLQNIRLENNFVDPDSTGQQISQQISHFESQQLETQIQLEETRALYAALQQELKNSEPESASSLALRENGLYQAILSRIQDVDAEIAGELARFQEGNPRIELLREHRQNLLPLLRREGEKVRSELASKIKELEARSQVLNNNIATLNERVKQLSSISREYNDIQRELKIATNNLTQFLSTREALRIDAAQKNQPWELLAPPGVPKPYSDSVLTNLILGSVLGLLMGLGAALALDKLTDVLYTPKEIKTISRLPLLGLIPLEHNQKQFALPGTSAITYPQKEWRFGINNNRFQNYKAAIFFEAFNSLYTNILSLSTQRAIQSFVVTSAMLADGKSTVATNLARAAAAMGQRVLLVDTDLRHPSLHERLGLVNIQGLTDVINLDLDFQNVIQQPFLTSENNLWVLTAGSSFIAPEHNPDSTMQEAVKILAAQKMKHLMEELHAVFDLVIYDAPPLIGIADAHLLAKYTDGVILVAGLGKTKGSLLEKAIDGLRTARTSVLGVVANYGKE